MLRKEIGERKVSYGINTDIKYIEASGVNRDYISVQHKHRDYELRLITSGKGATIIGDAIIECKKYDIILLGINVPHCPTLYISDEHDRMESIIIQFHPDIFPPKLFNLPDYIHVATALQKSQKGLLFQKRSLGIKVKKMMEGITQLKGVSKVSCILEILQILGLDDSGILAAEKNYSVENSFYNNQKVLQKVYDYLYENINKEVSLQEIAEHVNMNSTALCRAFKNKTKMSIFEFLNKIRIENVCRLLLYSDQSVSQIAYESGFNSMAYFNRRFKKITKMSPSEYRNKVEENNV